MTEIEMNGEFFAKRWPTHGAAESWLKRQKTTASKLGVNIVMAPDSGFCLERKDADPAVEAIKEDVALEAAVGRVREKDAKKVVVARVKAHKAGVAEDAKVKPEATPATEAAQPEEPIAGDALEASTALPESEQLLGRSQDGEVLPGRKAEAYLRFPVCGSTDKLRLWAAYYAASMRTVIDVVSVEGKLVERFDGRGAAKPAGEKPALPDQERGERKQRSARQPRQSLTGAEEKYFELASRPQGVLRSELTKLNGGISKNWKYVLLGVGKRRGYNKIAISKDGDSPNYTLSK